MSDITLWSNTAVSNNAAPPNGFPEGMQPSMVNDTCREIMAAVRRFCEDGGWFNWGHTYTRTSSTSFAIAGDVSLTYHIGRRVRATGATTGTIYGTITDSVYTTSTTVTVDWDSGALANETIVISLGYLSAAGGSGNWVDLSSNQTVGGVKTFTSFPVTPSSAPTTNYQTANKKYVDDQVAGIPAFSPVITRNPQTAAYTLLASDAGKEISCTNEWTLTLLAAATAGSGFYCWVRNNDTKTITIQANGSELIYHQGPGATTLKIYPYQAVLLQCNATNWEVISATGTDAPGTIKPYAGSTAPVGWFLCNGGQYDKNQYKALYDAITDGGTVFPWGANVNNNFKVPDLRGVSPLGKTASGTGSTLGATGGSLDHTHVIAEYQAITTTSANVASGENFAALTTATISTGGGTSASSNAPYLVVNFIIKY